MTRAIAPSSKATRLGWSLLVTALWIQLFAACIYGWKYGEYYDYGWYIPPLFAMFLWRIRHLFSTQTPASLPRPLLIGGMIVLTLGLFLLRVIERVDPRWTLPIWFQASMVITITLVAAHQLGGPKAAWRCVPIIIFACSAIPLPSVIEGLLVSSLTDGVVVSSSALLKIFGMNVQILGDRLAFMDEIVEVTEGCSGIRSAQSFLMSSLFFGELMRLGLAQRLALVGIGLIVAWVLNVVRASSLAAIQFIHGQEAFDQAHDNAGLLAFVAGSIILLIASSRLGKKKSGAVVRRRVERSHA